MKVGFVAGIFDVLHDGHVELLRWMRAESDHVVVVVVDDRSCWALKDKVPVQSLRRRSETLRITGLVDRVMPSYSPDPWREFARVLRKHRRDELTYMRGDDVVEGFPGHWYLRERAVPVRFKPYTAGVSSSAIRGSL